jgi:hypothetical protein
MVAALAIVASLAGWLAGYGWALSGPRLGGRGRLAHRSGAAHHPRVPATVVALLAGLSAADLFKVTLLHLGTRGWFRLTRSGGRAVCVIPAEAPVEELAPYEHAAVHHLAKRAGTHAQVPADAVADGFDGGESRFLATFRKNVIEQARARDLTRPTFSRRRKLLLCLAALPPAAAPMLAAIGSHRLAGGLVSICLFYYLVLCSAVIGVSSERLTGYGAQTLARLRAAPDPPGRVSEAALGRDIAVLAPFTAPGKNRAWSGHGENWRLVAVGNPARRVWPGISPAAARAIVLVTLPGTSVLMIAFALAGLGFQNGALAALGIDVVILITASAPWLRLSTRAEFEGQVLRQWNITGDGDDHSWSCCVAIDDGASQQAWALTVPGVNPDWLAPGTMVQVAVNPRLNKVRGIQMIRPPASASQLLNTTPDPRNGV